jgi:nucleoside-triphosphatase
MSLPDNILLLAGVPGVGKTTLVKKVAASLADCNISGFYTEEIRVRNVRQGFTLVTLNGYNIVMAHFASDSAFRVSKYGVDLAAIDRAVRMTLAENNKADLFIIDEIGKMECFSDLFVERVTALLDSGKPVLATISLKGGGFIHEVKNRPGVDLWEITKQNRDGMVGRVIKWLRSNALGDKIQNSE